MDVGISSAVFYPMLVEDSISKIAELGIKKIELFFNCDYEVSPEYLRGLSKSLRASEIEVVSLHPYTSLVEGVYFFSDYARRTDESIEKYKAYFDAAAVLGAKYFTFHGDRNLGCYTPYDTDCRPREHHLSALSRLADEASARGVTLCMENVSWCKSSNFEYLKTIAENVGKIGFTLDLKQAIRAGASAEEYIPVMKNRIKNVHISDFDDTHDCLLPGEGKCDFGKILNLLQKNSYAGDAIIEVYAWNFDTIRQIEASKTFFEWIIRKNRR